MSERANKLKNARGRAARTRAKVQGTAERPRLSVNISNTHVSAQVINDEEGKTIAAATSVGAKMKGSMTEIAATIGEKVATAAKAKKVKAVVLDRGNKKYHGRIKALADAARKNGLEF